MSGRSCQEPAGNHADRDVQVRTRHIGWSRKGALDVVSCPEFSWHSEALMPHPHHLTHPLVPNASRDSQSATASSSRVG